MYNKFVQVWENYSIRTLKTAFNHFLERGNNTTKYKLAFGGVEIEIQAPIDSD